MNRVDLMKESWCALDARVISKGMKRVRQSAFITTFSFALALSEAAAQTAEDDSEAQHSIEEDTTAENSEGLSGYELVDPEHPAQQGQLNVPAWTLFLAAILIAIVVILRLVMRARQAK